MMLKPKNGKFMTAPKTPSIAVLLPCYNEAQTISEVVKAFSMALPEAKIYVYDNNSTDNTDETARKAGASVHYELRQGKGNVVRRMFAEVEADIYVLADGDGTYAADDAPKLVSELTTKGLDMVVGVRKGIREDAGRMGHAIGNRLFNRLFRTLFKDAFTDIFSGYRVFSRRFVKSFPAVSTGFEIESELSVHALTVMANCSELPVSYGVRPEGSASKLNTLRDGSRILIKMILLLKEVRPLLFFGLATLVTVILSLIAGLPPIFEYLNAGVVTLMPRWVLAIGLMIFALILMACGLILDSVSRGRVEQKRLAYLNTDPTVQKET